MASLTQRRQNLTQVVQWFYTTPTLFVYNNNNKNKITPHRMTLDDMTSLFRCQLNVNNI